MNNYTIRTSSGCPKGAGKVMTVNVVVAGLTTEDRDQLARCEITRLVNEWCRVNSEARTPAWLAAWAAKSLTFNVVNALRAGRVPFDQFDALSMVAELNISSEGLVSVLNWARAHKGDSKADFSAFLNTVLAIEEVNAVAEDFKEAVKEEEEEAAAAQ